jgi:hypothetical protein
MSSSLPDRRENKAIIKFVGEPNELNTPGERSLWKRFLGLIWPWAAKGGLLVSKTAEMTEAFYAAEIAKKQSEADKFAAEAINITTQSDLQKQTKVKVVNDIISDIFSDDKLPETAKMLKLSNLLANNPEITEQWEKIEQMASKLKVVNFASFNLRIEREVPKEADSANRPDDSSLNKSS